MEKGILIDIDGMNLFCQLIMIANACVCVWCQKYVDLRLNMIVSQTVGQKACSNSGYRYNRPASHHY